jgi:hypothetical protein
MATNRVWVGGGNNKASNPKDWSPNGVPEPGDNLTMSSGIMRIRDTDLLNDELVIPRGSSSTVSLQNATVEGQGVGIATFGNLHADLSGKTDALTLLTAGTSSTTVDLAANTTWVGGFEALGNLTVNGGNRSVFESTGFGQPVQGSQVAGSNVTLNTAVGGSSPFFIFGGVLGHTESKLEFGSSVASSQAVNLFGVEADPNGQLTSKPILQIDSPNDFNAAVSLNNFEPNAEEDINLIGLAQAVIPIAMTF